MTRSQESVTGARILHVVIDSTERLAVAVLRRRRRETRRTLESGHRSPPTREPTTLISPGVRSNTTCAVWSNTTSWKSAETVAG
ncbi:hypothetical protein C8039_00810 [Halogeometricum sp. wsp3]|nr:hypothetical protein C8039_00810 [Halogeometricum sp. wsp3]